jgi:hypothetical protein
MTHPIRVIPPAESLSLISSLDVDFSEMAHMHAWKVISTIIHLDNNLLLQHINQKIFEITFLIYNLEHNHIYAWKTISTIIHLDKKLEYRLKK